MVTNGSEGNRRRQYMKGGGYKWEVASPGGPDEAWLVHRAEEIRNPIKRMTRAEEDAFLAELNADVELRNAELRGGAPASRNALDYRRERVAALKTQWADTDAREARETLEWEAQFSSSKTAALEVERATALRQPSTSDPRPADEPGLGVRATSAAWRLSRGILGPSNNPDRPSQLPEGRRLRYLQSKVDAGLYPDIEAADAATTRKGRPR